MAKSAKKRGINSKGVKRVSKDRIAVGVSNFAILNKLKQ